MEITPIQRPVCADVYITDCDRQDMEQFAGQYVWTVKIKIWFGHLSYYPRLGDEQFDLSFDIPADWASDGWEVAANSAIYSTDSCMPDKKRQAMKAIDMNGNPMKSAPWLIKRATDHGILSSGTLPFEATKQLRLEGR